MQKDMFQPWVQSLVNYNLKWIVYIIVIISFIPSFIWFTLNEFLPEIYNDYKYTLQEISKLKKGS